MTIPNKPVVLLLSPCVGQAKITPETRRISKYDQKVWLSLIFLPLRQQAGTAEERMGCFMQIFTLVSG